MRLPATCIRYFGSRAGFVIAEGTGGHLDGLVTAGDVTKDTRMQATRFEANGGRGLNLTSGMTMKGGPHSMD